jgi:hypothetical protein
MQAPILTRQILQFYHEKGNEVSLNPAMNDQTSSHQFPTAFRDRLGPLYWLHIDGVANSDLRNPDCAQEMCPSGIGGLLESAGFGWA